jgi:hypothetical protein
MRIVVRAPGGDRDLDVALRNPEATLHDLLHAAFGAGVPESVAIGKRIVACSCRVLDAGLHEGAVVAPAPPRSAQRAVERRSRLELVVVAGVHAGRAYPLAPGRSVPVVTRRARSCWRIRRIASSCLTRTGEGRSWTLGRQTRRSSTAASCERTSRWLSLRVP